ncbi:MAG: MFS transporter [Gammaproteobacteria bacterium]
MKHPADSESGPPRYVPLVGLAWLHFVNDGAANFLPGVLPAVLITMGLKPALAGTLMFALLAGQGLQPLAGMLGCFLGGRRLMWFGVMVTVLGSGLVGIVTGLPGLLIVLVLIGVGNACFHPQALAAARGFSGSRGHFGVAVMMLGGEIGRGLWPLIASVVVVWGALESLWVPALIALVSLPLVAWRLPRADVPSTQWRIRLRGRMGATARLLAYVVLRGLAVMGAVTYLPMLWNARGGGLIGGASLVTLMLIVGLVGTLYGGHLADRIGRRPVLFGAGVLMAFCLALIALGSTPALWLGAPLLGIPAFATFPLTTVEGQDIFPENRPFGSGIALGLGNALGAGLVALLGFCAGALPVADLFWILAAAALVTAPLGMLLHTQHHGSDIL